MYKLTLSNNYGQLTFGAGGPYTISEIEGLSPPEADINMNAIALLDGQKYNSAKMKIRTLNIAFAIEYNAEANRLAAYKILRVKKPIRMTYTSELRNVYIDGYISNVNVTHFEMKQICTVSIVCPSPYFRAAQETINELSAIIGAFHFPFSIAAINPIPFSYIEQYSNVVIENAGDIDTGLTITLYARKSITNPKIFNYETGEFIGLDYTMQAGDEITITTMIGEKTVTLLRDGQTINLFNYIMANSTWLQLDGSECTFVYEVGTGDLQDLEITFAHYDLYEGV